MYQWDPDVPRQNKQPVDFTDWQYTTVAQLCYDICHRQKIGRNRIISHASISPNRGDPQGFDRRRFLGWLGGMLGDDFKVD